MSDPLGPGDIHNDKDEKKKWILFLSQTILDRETMDEDDETMIKQDNQNDNDDLVSDPLEPGGHG